MKGCKKITDDKLRFSYYTIDECIKEITDENTVLLSGVYITGSFKQPYELMEEIMSKNFNTFLSTEPCLLRILKTG